MGGGLTEEKAYGKLVVANAAGSINGFQCWIVLHGGNICDTLDGGRDGRYGHRKHTFHEVIAFHGKYFFSRGGNVCDTRVTCDTRGYGFTCPRWQVRGSGGQLKHKIHRGHSFFFHGMKHL